jgi:predicted PurR-regulated permease PerM
MALLVVLIYSLGSILTPFLIAALLAYLGDPIADRIENLGVKRSFSVVIVFAFVGIIFSSVILLLTPILHEQSLRTLEKIPIWLNEINLFIEPYISKLNIAIEADSSDSYWKNIVFDHIEQSGAFAFSTAKTITSSGAIMLGLITNIILIPVLTFYLLRDWDILIDKINKLLPYSIKPTVLKLTDECNQVISSFFRGQFIIMMFLAGFYSTCLYLLGLDTPLTIGLIAGLANIIPYMGFVVGIVTALFAAWMEFHMLTPLILVVLIFSAGQLIEGMFLTPVLIGDKIGLHPVAVIFSLMAGAKLAGFTGLLIALPIAAIIMVMVRYLISYYKQSNIFSGPQTSTLDINDDDTEINISHVAPVFGDPVNHTVTIEEDIDSIFYEEIIWQNSHSKDPED